MCDKFDEASINQIEKKILKTYPNTYTFSKNLAEQIVASRCRDLPVAIVRPSIIGASLKEPCPGWIQGTSALTGILLLASRGCATAIRGRKDARLDVVPVDFIVDAIISIAWHVTLHSEHEVKVYNCTSSANPFRWGQLQQLVLKHSRETPLNDTLWYPDNPIIANRYIYKVRSVISYLPAFVIDIFLRLRGSKPMENCSDLARKVKMLNDSDMVKLDLGDMNWEKYIAIYLMGIRKFILKQEFQPTARQRLSRLYWIDQISKMFGIMIVLWIIYLIMY
ncbi:fatty acyl-CoA reductase 1-like isoform X2 [Bombus affinis]|uniref:fatty acyl-CoA reductase 1-like isoform X2 n=1 Tax=Bombus affinis TaxID=309941 RepID=UPI0021B73ACF|nr:fatty acyl-CoA reductase 1-like isoform X2 [Bombus affinis]